MFNILKLLINLNFKEKRLVTFFVLNLINLFIEILILASIIPITQTLLNIQAKIPFVGDLNFWIVLIIKKSNNSRSYINFFIFN